MEKKEAFQNLSILVELSLSDKKVFDFYKSIDSLCKEKEAKKQVCVHIEESIAKIKASIIDFKGQVALHEKEISAIEKSIIDYKTYLTKIKTNEEYKEYLQKISDEKRAKKEKEDQLIILLEKEEELNTELLECKSIYMKKSDDYKQEAARIDKECSTLESYITDIDKTRNILLAKLPLSMREDYALILKRRKAVTTVPINDSFCGGCHTPLRTNEINKVLTCHEIIQCSVCQCYLYNADDFSFLTE